MPEELHNLVNEKDAKRTKRATEQMWRTFTSYCEENLISFDINTTSVLKVRKPDGELYRKTSLNCLRHGLNPKIKSVHNDWDIIRDTDFTSRGEAFIAQCTRLKRE